MAQIFLQRAAWLALALAASSGPGSAQAPAEASRIAQLFHEQALARQDTSYVVYEPGVRGGVLSKYRHAGEPKALAICIDWDVSTPARAVIRGSAESVPPDTWPYGARSRHPERVRQEALDGCERMKAHHKTRCDCAMADIDGRNVLSLPDRFVAKLGAIEPSRAPGPRSPHGPTGAGGVRARQ